MLRLVAPTPVLFLTFVSAVHSAYMEMQLTVMAGQELVLRLHRLDYPAWRGSGVKKKGVVMESRAVSFLPRSR